MTYHFQTERGNTIKEDKTLDALFMKQSKQPARRPTDSEIRISTPEGCIVVWINEDEICPSAHIACRDRLGNEIASCDMRYPVKKAMYQLDINPQGKPAQIVYITERRNQAHQPQTPDSQ